MADTTLLQLVYTHCTIDKATVSLFKLINVCLSAIGVHSSIVRMFAAHRDDKKKVEKALEAARLPAGKVSCRHTTKTSFANKHQILIQWWFNAGRWSTNNKATFGQCILFARFAFLIIERDCRMFVPRWQCMPILFLMLLPFLSIIRFKLF